MGRRYVLFLRFFGAFFAAVPLTGKVTIPALSITWGSSKASVVELPAYGGWKFRLGDKGR
jgi:hypothetical protein